MNRQNSELTIGQAFAARWLARKYDEYKVNSKMRQRQPRLPQPEQLAQQIAEAVDAQVEQKIDELRRKLRSVALAASDGEKGSSDQMGFGSDELLKSRKLVQVAQNCLNTTMSAVYEFPV